VATRKGELKVAPGDSEILAAEKAGVITSQETQALLRLEELTHEIIAVDDFAPDELGTKPFRSKPKRGS
jgi:Acyl-CoA dehydrogenase, C-terminal, bacterial type